MGRTAESCELDGVLYAAPGVWRDARGVVAAPTPLLQAVDEPGKLVDAEGNRVAPGVVTDAPRAP